MDQIGLGLSGRWGGVIWTALSGFTPGAGEGVNPLYSSLLQPSRDWLLDIKLISTVGPWLTHFFISSVQYRLGT